MYTKQLIT